MLKLLTFILLVAISTPALSTTFVPISIKTQIKEANSIIYGELTSQESEVLPDGNIVTKFTLRADKWIGVKIENKGKFIDVYTLGGEVRGRVVEIQGAPKISFGEKVVLLIGKDESGRNWIKNFGLGKYSAKKVGKEMVLVNQVFPMHPQMGQIRLSHFIGLAERIKEKKFTSRFKDKYEIQRIKQTIYKAKSIKKGRSIASVADDTRSRNKMGTLGLVLLLGILGGGITVFRRKNQD